MAMVSKIRQNGPPIEIVLPLSLYCVDRLIVRQRSSGKEPLFIW